MKNAYVLVHHYGDDGNAYEGRILKNVTSHRFEELQKQGLIREATAEEVKVGDQPAFEKDNSMDREDPAPENGEKQKPVPQNKKAPEPSNKSN